MPPKLTIADAHAAAAKYGGECLSTEYINGKTKMDWRCSEGHEWKAWLANIRMGKAWCPICAGKQRLSLDQIRQIARKRGGDCLSDQYEDQYTVLRWKCSYDHEWRATLKRVKSGSWCQLCYHDSLRDTIEKMKEIANKRGGKCLSEKYGNNQTKLTWECCEGHLWEATPHSIKIDGTWCPECFGTPKLSIENMRVLAEDRGGSCLSNEYIDNKTPLRWKCLDGHEWSAAPSKIKNAGHWCPTCGGTQKLTIEQMQEIAHNHGGKCLSQVYINVQTKLKWLCAEEHEWDASPLSVKLQDAWCPTCAGVRKLTIDEMKEIARGRGGECLSKVYTNILTNLEWRCSEGHEWKAPPKRIKALGGWCPTCAIKETGLKKRDTIETMMEIAHSRGGLCLSEEYTNSDTNLEWQCALGHQWKAKPSNIKHNGTWCPKCCFDETKLTIEEMKRIAFLRGGECLSMEYVNSSSKLLWKCARGHKWKAIPAKIKHCGHWCPYCRFKNEDECRKIIERLTKKKFPKKRPNWLGGLELDGYNSQLEIAFEYQGEQHHKVIPAWHASGQADLDAQQERDAVKAAACEDYGVGLVVIDFDSPDKLGCIGRQLAAIHRKRYAALVAARQWDNPVPVKFTIKNTDRIWRELEL